MMKQLLSMVLSLVALTLPAAVDGLADASAEPEGHDSRSIRHKIADAYGVHAFERVERLSFTFNVAAGERRVRRAWTWWPRENRVRFEGGSGAFRDEPYEYLKAELARDSTTEMVEVDQRFINDTYWLVFPYHVEWDLAADVTEEGTAPLPIGPEEGRAGGPREATRVVVDYPDVGGYTPGDTYEIYVGGDYRILQWVYRPGGSEETRYAYTWGDEIRFGDVTFATEFGDADGSVRIWLSDIEVEFTEE